MRASSLLTASRMTADSSTHWGGRCSTLSNNEMKRGGGAFTPWL